MWKLGKITAKTHIGDYGQIVDSFVLLLTDTCCEEVKMTNGTDFILEKNYNFSKNNLIIQLFLPFFSKEDIFTTSTLRETR